MTDLVGELQSLLEHPGWHWFVGEVRKDWGAGGQRFESLINKLADSREEDPLVLRQMQQVAVARREILMLMQRPEEELANLRRKATPLVADERRREMPKELVGLSRRGGL